MRPLELLSRSARIAAAAALVLGAAACAGSSRVGFPNVSPFYTTGVVRYAAGGGAMPLVVHGRPFAGLSQQQTAEKAAAQMRLPGWFPPIPFQPAPVEGAPTGNYRTVLVFNPSQRSTDGSDSCGPLEQIGTAPPDTEIRVVAAFCTGTEVITAVSGGIAQGGPDSPAFAHLLSQIGFALFPPRNPLHVDDERRGSLFGRPWWD